MNLWKFKQIKGVVHFKISIKIQLKKRKLFISILLAILLNVTVCRVSIFIFNYITL